MKKRETVMGVKSRASERRDRLRRKKRGDKKEKKGEMGRGRRVQGIVNNLKVVG